MTVSFSTKLLKPLNRNQFCRQSYHMGQPLSHECHKVMSLHEFDLKLRLRWPLKLDFFL